MIPSSSNSDVEDEVCDVLTNRSHVTDVRNNNNSADSAGRDTPGTTAPAIDSDDKLAVEHNATTCLFLVLPGGTYLPGAVPPNVDFDQNCAIRSVASAAQEVPASHMEQTVVSFQNPHPTDELIVFVCPQAASKEGETLPPALWQALCRKSAFILLEDVSASEKILKRPQYTL